MRYLLFILKISFFNFIFSNPNAWHDDPSGGSSMPFFLIIIGVIFLVVWLKSEL